MAIGEFILAFAGIILGLGVGDLLLSFHRLLRAGRAVKWHWLTPLMAALMFLAVVVFWWWSYLGYAGVTSITIADFAPFLLFLALNFLMVASVLPDEVPAEGLDLETFYFASATHVWSLVGLSLILAYVLGGIRGLTDHSPAEVFLGAWPSLVSCILAVACLAVRKSWLHGLTMLWIIGVTVYGNWDVRIG